MTILDFYELHNSCQVALLFPLACLVILLPRLHYEPLMDLLSSSDPLMQWTLARSNLILLGLTLPLARTGLLPSVPDHSPLLSDSPYGRKADAYDVVATIIG